MKLFDLSRARYLLQNATSTKDMLKNSLKEAVDFVEQFQQPLDIEGGWVSLDKRDFIQYQHLYNEIIEVKVRPELWWYTPETDDLGTVRLRLIKDDLEKMLTTLESTPV